MKQSGVTVEQLKLRRGVVRNEIAFIVGDAAHGGSHHGADLKAFQAELKELDAEIEKRRG